MSAPTPPRVAVVGLGRAGSALVRSLRRARVPLVATVSQRAADAHEALALDEPPVSHVRALDGRDIDIALLAIPDDALVDVGRELALLAEPPRIVAHLSGARGPSALDVLGERAAAFHPLAALAHDAPVPEGALVALDARSGAARDALGALARRLGLSPVVVDEGARPLYHAGAAITANLSIALVSISAALFARAGVDDETARRGLTTLLASTVANLEHSPSLSSALTGAVARGDVGTIASHLAALSFDDELVDIYRALSLRLVPLSPALDRHEALVHALTADSEPRDDDG